MSAGHTPSELAAMAQQRAERETAAEPSPLLKAMTAIATPQPPQALLDALHRAVDARSFVALQAAALTLYSHGVCDGVGLATEAVRVQFGGGA